jgi:hypothetical protein
VAPASDCNPVYGASIGRGSFKFATGQWTTVSERVKLNTPGKADGELELFANGKSVVNISGLILRDSAAGKMRGIQMQTFFGGVYNLNAFMASLTTWCRIPPPVLDAEGPGRLLLRLFRRDHRKALNDTQRQHTIITVSDAERPQTLHSLHIIIVFPPHLSLFLEFSVLLILMCLTTLTYN